MYAPEDTTIGGEEIKRKLIHISASIAAAVLVLVGHPRHSRGLLLGLAATAVLVEISRTLSPGINSRFVRHFGNMLRYRERRGLTGATTLAFGFVAAAFTVPSTLAAAAILMAGTGDAVGALVGKRYGRIRIGSGKSLEGSTACLITAMIAAIIIPGISPEMALAAAPLVTLLELASTRFDDNLVLPLGAALALAATKQIFA